MLVLLVLSLVALGHPSAAAASGLTDRDAVRPIPPLSRPAAGSAYTDPAFGTTIRRVSDLSEHPCTPDGCPFEVHTYSQLQAFNADSTLMLLTTFEGYRVRRVSDLSEIRAFPGYLLRAPRWNPMRRNVLVHFDREDDADVTLQETNVRTGVTRDLHTFARYRAIVRDPSFEELSRDGRWLAGYAVRGDGDREIFTFDLVERRVELRMPLARACEPDLQYGLLDPNWVAPSPRGRYLVIQWEHDGTSRCSGIETYGIRRGNFAGRLVSGHPHGDLGIASGGREFFMTGSDHPDDPNMTGLAWYRLPGRSTTARPHYVQLLDWKALMSHVSCQGPPGVCLVTSVDDPDATCCRPGWQPFEGEVWLQYIEDGERRNYGPVRRLAHHRSSEQGYWAQPKATLSRDGRYAVFGSDWGIEPGRERVDPYLIELGGLATAGRAVPVVPDG